MAEIQGGEMMEDYGEAFAFDGPNLIEKIQEAEELILIGWGELHQIRESLIEQLPSLPGYDCIRDDWKEKEKKFKDYATKYGLKLP